MDRSEHIVFDAEKAVDVHQRAFSKPYVYHIVNLEEMFRKAFNFIESHDYSHAHFFSGNEFFLDICASQFSGQLDVVTTHSQGKLVLLWDYPYFSHDLLPSSVFTCILWDSEWDHSESKAWSPDSSIGGDKERELKKLINGKTR